MKSSVIEILSSQLGPKWKTKKFIIAVSGGGDSMSLLHLFASEKCDFIVAHVNYGLRKIDSDLDQDCVAQFCKKNDLLLKINQPDTERFCEENKMSIQEGARLVRYEWFDKLLHQYDADYIITAHHQEDLIETFIINLQRGSGIKGLHPLPVLNRNKLRPLITTPKLDIMQYLSDHCIDYREDLSNAKNDYLRNSIRNTVLPELYVKLPKLKKGILSTIEHLRLDSDFLFEQLEKEKEAVFIPKKLGGVISNYKNHHKRLLFHIISEFGFNFDQLEQLLTSNKSGKNFHSKTHQLLINRTDLLIEKLDFNSSSLLIEILDFGMYQFNGKKFIVTNSTDAKWGNPDIAFFPADKLSFPFIIRKWKAGDSFTPFGMKGQKKISDYLIDNKVSAIEKEAVSVLEHQLNIAWVIGYRTSESYKSDAICKNWIAIKKEE
jgi:tRNA(Ile)-lysidine synthase